MELLYFPRTIDAAEAAELGLATRVVAADEVAATAAELAGRLATGPTLAYAALRASVANSATSSFPDALAFEAEMMGRTGASQDHLDAVAAFVAKERPTFHGR